MAYRELYTASGMAGEHYNVNDRSLALTPAQIHFTVEPRGIREGSFVVSAEPGMRLRGLVTSDCLNMQVMRAEITGSPDRISWRFDAGTLEAEEKCEGSFCIVTNCGEYRLPFTAAIASAVHSGGEVKETGRSDSAAARLLEQADRDWGSAVELFYRREFASSLITDEEKLLYRGLSAVPGSEQNVEEFLIAACGKTPVSFETDVKEIRTEIFASGSGRSRSRREEPPMIEHTLVIRREGWGYTHLQVQAEGSFLKPGAGAVVSRDFIGDRCGFPLFIDRSKLHAGRNFGSVVLRSPSQEIRIPAEVISHRESRSRARQGSDFSRILTQMMRHYERLHLSFVRQRMEPDAAPDSGEWLRRAYELVQRLQMIRRDSPVPCLYRAQILLMENRVHQAVLELEGLRRRLAGVSADEVLEMGFTQYPGESQIEYCYRQFLAALAYNDADEITPRVGRILRERYRKTPADWRIAWMMIQLLPEYAKGTPARWNFLKKQFTNGSRSPILYLEAFEMIAAEPEYLNLTQDRRTGRYGGDAFERQVILYAVKKDIMDTETMKHVLARTDRRRDFQPFLYRTLCEAYGAERLAPIRGMILESICRMLIRGGKADEQYFAWFSRAVDKKLQLARLPDFFLQSMPEDYQGEIPAIVVEGAAHGTAVSGNNRAYWYRYLYENRGRYGAVYNRYREEIRSYLETQIAEHRITENLAFLYSASLRDPAIEPPNAGDLTKLSYMSHLRTTHMNMRWAVVVYANSSGEKRFPVVNGNCTMPLYGTDNCIFLEDAQHNRYAVSVPYTCDPMMQPVVCPDRVSAQEMDDLPFALEIAGAGDKEQSVTAQTAGYCALLVRSGKVSPSYRARLAYKLLLYYEKTGERARMNSLWDLVDLTQLSREERLALVSLMSRSGQNTRAARWILSHGAAQTGAELLGEICMGAARETAADSMAGEEGAPGAEGKRSPSGIRVMSGAVRRKAEGQQYLTGRQLSRLAYGAFRRGFHSNDLLELLVREYDGSLQELDAVRKMLAQDPGREERTHGQNAQEINGQSAPEMNGQNAEPVDEQREGLTLMACENRMLRQMLFSGDMIPEASGLIIRMYDRDDDRRGRELALYGLAQYCHYVFAQSRSMEENIMAFITRLKKDGQAHEPIVQLAFLKSLLERPNGFDEEEAEAASVFLTSLLGNNIVFPFYRRFSGAGAGLRLYDRETMIEYHRPAGVRTADGHVVIHYASSRGKQQEPFVSREMKEMVPGFYVSSFFLFYAEQIHYFITDDPEEKSIVETGTIVSDAYTGPGSQMAQDRFRRINELSECAAEGSRERTLQLLEEYRQREYLTSVLFDSGEEQA